MRLEKLVLILVLVVGVLAGCGRVALARLVT
jgi:hypothetical protein